MGDKTQRLQLDAFHRGIEKTRDGRPATLSMSSFICADIVKNVPKNEVMNIDVFHQSDYKVDGGQPILPGIRQPSDNSRVLKDNKYENIERPRSAISSSNAQPKKETWMKRSASQISSIMFDDPRLRTAEVPTNQRIEDITTRRDALLVARSAVQNESVMANRLNEMDSLKNLDESPGVYSMHVVEKETELRETRRKDRLTGVLARTHNDNDQEICDAFVKQMKFNCRNDPVLNTQLLYEPKYDNNWKSKYTTEFLKEGNIKKSTIVNKQGWVIPLKNLCDNVGIDPTFFISNNEVTLDSARSHILWNRVCSVPRHSGWLAEHDPTSLRNANLEIYLMQEVDVRAVACRAAHFQDHLLNDKDLQRCYGQYYNNIYLGKRFFGPAKKQIYLSTIIGGMERRFETLDNPVNHQPFTHVGSDRNVSKCRNIGIKCNDQTRVEVKFNSVDEDDRFIHANHIKGGPLFNQFILTQSPMENTIGDFWRMVWQEKAPYIFMLVSRKDPLKSVRYWPRRRNEEMVAGGVVIVNCGIDSSRDPLMRVTALRLETNGEVHRLEHWQGDLNNADNLQTPLQMLQLVRSCTKPVVFHDCLGVSRAACLIAAEIAICNILRGPTYKYTATMAIHHLRSCRPFAIETAIQFIYVNRIIQLFFSPIVGHVSGLEADYHRWLESRAQRLFLDDVGGSLPGHRKLSPVVDPDLLRQVRRPYRSDVRREPASAMGDVPLPVDPTLDNSTGPQVKLPNKYTRQDKYSY